MKQRKGLGPGTKIEGTSILAAGFLYAVTGNPVWFAALLAIVVFSLTIHSLAVRLTHQPRTTPYTARKGATLAKRHLKKLPPLAISAQTPLAHRIKPDGRTFTGAAQAGRLAGKVVRQGQAPGIRGAASTHSKKAIAA